MSSYVAFAEGLAPPAPLLPPPRPTPATGAPSAGPVTPKAPQNAPPKPAVDTLETSRYWTRYAFSAKCQRPAEVITSPKVFPIYFFNVCENKTATPVRRRLRVDLKKVSRDNGALADKLIKYMRLLRASADGLRKAQTAARARFFSERKQREKDIARHARYMQQLMVAALKKRNFLQLEELKLVDDVVKTKIRVLHVKLDSCQNVLASMQQKCAPALPASFFIPPTKLLAASIDVRRVETQQEEVRRDLQKLSRDVVEIKAQLQAEDSRPRKARARSVVAKVHRLYYSGKISKYLPVHGDEYEFERILFDQRNREGRTLAKWISILESKDKKRIPPGLISSNVEQFTRGFAADFGIPEKHQPTLSLLFRRIIFRRIKTLIHTPDIDTERQLQDQLRWMCKLTQQQLGIDPQYCLDTGGGAAAVRDKEEKNDDQDEAKHKGPPSRASAESQDADEPAIYKPGRPYARAIATLEELPQLCVPVDMMNCLLAVAEVIYKTAREYAARRAGSSPHARAAPAAKIGADSFFPILLFVVSHARLPGIQTSVYVMRVYATAAERSSESGYYLTAFEGAVHYIMQSDPKQFEDGGSPFITAPKRMRGDTARTLSDMQRSRASGAVADDARSGEGVGHDNTSRTNGLGNEAEDGGVGPGSLEGNTTEASSLAGQSVDDEGFDAYARLDASDDEECGAEPGEAEAGSGVGMEIAEGGEGGEIKATDIDGAAVNLQDSLSQRGLQLNQDRESKAGSDNPSQIIIEPPLRLGAATYSQEDSLADGIGVGGIGARSLLPQSVAEAPATAGLRKASMESSSVQLGSGGSDEHNLGTSVQSSSPPTIDWA